jgi:hypothetical protein
MIFIPGFYFIILYFINHATLKPENDLNDNDDFLVVYETIVKYSRIHFNDLICLYR